MKRCPIRKKCSRIFVALFALFLVEVQSSGWVLALGSQPGAAGQCTTHRAAKSRDTELLVKGTFKNPFTVSFLGADGKLTKLSTIGATSKVHISTSGGSWMVTSEPGSCFAVFQRNSGGMLVVSSPADATKPAIWLSCPLADETRQRVDIFAIDNKAHTVLWYDPTRKVLRPFETREGAVTAWTFGETAISFTQSKKVDGLSGNYVDNIYRDSYSIDRLSLNAEYHSLRQTGPAFLGSATVYRRGSELHGTCRVITGQKLAAKRI